MGLLCPECVIYISLLLLVTIYKLENAVYFSSIFSFRSSVVFVASLYTIIFILGMSSVLLQQLLFISFNLTGDEWRKSSRNKPFWEVFQRHRYNNGIIIKWIDFLFLQDVRSIAEEVV